MNYKKKGSLQWLEFEQLQAELGINHGVFLKDTSYDQLIAYSKGSVLCLPKQCHGVEIKQAMQGHQQICDGLYTDRSKQRLVIQHADCQAALFYDPINHVVANIHAGWRGNVQNIYAHTIKKLYQLYSCRPENLKVCISPSLGPCCAEFKNYKEELPQSFWQFQVRPTYFDLWEVSRTQLEKEGVASNNIEIAQICTCCNPMYYHSYRRDKTSLRHYTIIGLNGR
jgi:YfiH family protein